ncbi:MAG: hypothetical protein IJX13_04960, partial [Clostridia bacterium]|nr:hypothetical protein [Clostridia bacterium]
MKQLLTRIGLQFFGEGGTASSGSGSTASGVGGERTGTPASEAADAAIPANIPPRARKHYLAALEDVKRQNAGSANETSPQASSADAETAKSPAKRSYRELVESEEYKADHQRAIQKAVKDRMKARDAELAEVNELLRLAARGYGLDPAAESFRSDLKQALLSDDSAI